MFQRSGCNRPGLGGEWERLRHEVREMCNEHGTGKDYDGASKKILTNGIRWVRVKADDE